MQQSDPAIHAVTGKREGRGRRKTDEHRPWQEVAPRWLLVCVISVLLAACGYLWGLAAAKEAREEKARAREMEMLKAAVEQAEHKGQQRTNERVAVAEQQIRQILEENRELKVTMKQMVAATQENTSQLRLLTAQIKRSN